MTERPILFSGIMFSAAAIMLAFALSGCSVAAPAPEPTTGLELERAMAGGWDYDAMILRDRETGRRFTMLRDQPARPLLMADGRQSGCREEPAA